MHHLPLIARTPKSKEIGPLSLKVEKMDDSAICTFIWYGR
jgi:hypothetical protein